MQFIPKDNPVKPWPIGRQILVAGAIALVAGAGWFARAPALTFLGERGWLGNAEGRSAGRGGTGRGNGDGGVPVIVAGVGEARNDDEVVAVGTGRALRTATLYSETDGIVSAVAVRAGAQVGAGEPILKLDTAMAELAVEIARQRLAQAERALERADFLKRRNVQSNASSEDARTSVELARLELKQAQEALADTVIVAPFSGVVSLPEVDVGDRVTTSTRVATIDDRTSLLVEFVVPENFFSRIALGTPVTAQTPAVPGRTFEGPVQTIDARIDTSSRTVRVRAAIANADDSLRPGMSFSVRIVFRGDTYASIPELALQYEAGRPFVWRVEGKKAVRVDVETIRRLNTTALVAGALAPGDLVIIEGVQRVREGKAVVFDPPATSLDRSGEGGEPGAAALAAPNERG